MASEAAIEVDDTTADEVERLPRGAKATISEFRSKMAAAKACYKKADAAYQKLLKQLTPGVVYRLDAKRTVELRDKFAEKTKVWKPCGLEQFDVVVTDVSG